MPHKHKGRNQMKQMMHQTFSRLTGHNKSMLAFLGFLALSLLAVALPPWKAQADEAHVNASSLAGTWRVEVPDFAGTFISYETFTRDGGSVEINRPGTFNASVGTWKRIGPRKFLATIYKQQFKILENGVE